MMKRRRIRRGEIFAIAVSLAFAMFGTWYRAAISSDGILAQGGVMGLTAYLLCQLLLNAEHEIAYETVNQRIDLVEDCLHRHGVDVRPRGRDERI